MEAITGRKTFYLYEFNHLVTAENILIAYKSSKRSTNWAEWTASNPKLANLLNEAAKLYDQIENNEH